MWAKAKMALTRVRRKKRGQLFGLPLARLIPADGRIPGPLKALIARLARDGPKAKGLFRVSANAKRCRETRELLDSGKHVDVDALPILLVGALLKEFLRAMPDSLM